MTAFLWEDLIFQLDGRGPCPLQKADRANGVDRVAETSVGIDDKRKINSVGDRGQRVSDFSHRGEANIRSTEVHVGYTGASDIDRLIAQVMNNPGEHCVRCTRNSHRLTGGDQCLQLLCVPHDPRPSSFDGRGTARPVRTTVPSKLQSVNSSHVKSGVFNAVADSLNTARPLRFSKQLIRLARAGRITEQDRGDYSAAASCPSSGWSIITVLARASRTCLRMAASAASGSRLAIASKIS